MKNNEYTEITQGEFIAFINTHRILTTKCDDKYMYFILDKEPVGCKSLEDCKYYMKNPI